MRVFNLNMIDFSTFFFKKAHIYSNLKKSKTGTLTPWGKNHLRLAEVSIWFFQIIKYTREKAKSFKN